MEPDVASPPFTPHSRRPKASGSAAVATPRSVNGVNGGKGMGMK